MRLRNIPGAREEMLVNPYVIQEPETKRGELPELFEKEAPLMLEIGMGKGQFLTTLAQQNPQNNYIGIEKYSSVLLRALEKQEQLALPNLLFLRLDAERITEIFTPGQVSGIYLNFSDPWPKDRHAKRRLTSVSYLQRYEQLLAEGKTVEFKTDNLTLFEFSLESIREAGWQILLETRDLHHSPYAEGNVMTEYEERFSAQGNPICKLICTPGRKDRM